MSSFLLIHFPQTLHFAKISLNKTFMSILKNLQLTYNHIASDHASYHPRLWPGLKPFIQKIQPDQKVLDLGCGHGRVLNYLPKQLNYTGIDFSKKWLNQARQSFPSHNFIQADLTKPQAWQDLDQFDAILTIAFIHHLPEKSQQLFVLKQAKKHLKKDGLLILTTWRLLRPKFAIQHLKSLPLKIKHLNLRFLKIPYKDTNHSRFYTALDKTCLQKLLKQAGFNIKSVKQTEDNLIFLCF